MGFPFSPSIIKDLRPPAAVDIGAPPILAAPVPDRAGPCPARAQGDGVRLVPLELLLPDGRSQALRRSARADHVLILLSHGQARVCYPWGGTILLADRLAFIPAGTPFRFALGAGVQGQAVLIAPQWFYAALPPLPGRPVVARAGSRTGPVRAALPHRAERSATRGAQDVSVLSGLLALARHEHGPPCPAPAHSAQACPVPACPAPARPAPTRADRNLVDRFLDLARGRLGSAETVAELAAHLGSRLAPLDQACLAVHGKRAIALVHGLQLEGAVRLLRDTNRPVHRIAADLGYSSHAHLIRAFAAATGRRPDMFRAQSR